MASSGTINIAFLSKPCRDCDFQLCSHDGAVYYDFAKKNGEVKLMRISFDGYGCCNCGNNIKEMNSDDSKKLIELSNNNSDDQAEQITSILRKYFAENIKVLWDDALTEYKWFQ